MSLPQAFVTDDVPSGYWRVYVHPYAKVRRDVTFFRGAATQIAQMSTKDPFGPAAASVSFPAITLLDSPGSGDLDWCLPESNIDIVWVSADPEAEQEPMFAWEGYIVSFEYSGATGLTLACTGAMMQLDNYLAKPLYVYQPLPYERAIELQFEGHPDLRLAPLSGYKYGKYIAIADFDPGPTSEKDAKAAKWAGNTGQKPLAWPKTGDPPYRVVQTVEPHGLLERDVVRISSSSVKKGSGKRNNGTFGVLRVLSDHDFLVRMPLGATTYVSNGGNLVKPGHLRARHPTMFPDWWTRVFDATDKTKYPTAKPFLLPSGVVHGEKWTGMLTRDTGKFEPSLSNYVQGLLANMHTHRGQFTLLLDQGRRPYLTHRDHMHAPTDSTLVVDLLWPGVAFGSLSRDFSQRIGVVYAQGRAVNGDTYTGMQVTADGSSTWYDPAAYRRQVHPELNNPWLDKSKMRKEVMISYSDGLDEEEAKQASTDHLQRFADPGLTGTLTLNVDPRRGGELFPRQAIAAGMSIQVKGVFGRPEGALFHITEQQIDAESKVTLTLDSLFRDHLTVEQVRKRGHDSLVPYRMLSTAGTYDPKIPDLLFPWSYKNGSGCIPYGAKDLFATKGPQAVAAASVSGPYDVPFPWEAYTTRFPPKDNPRIYIKVPPADHTNANKNWANSATQGFTPYKVMLAAAGEIKLLQIAAYDKYGKVKRVPFHVSIWYSSNVSPSRMPMIPGGGWKRLTKLGRANTTNGQKLFSVTNLPKGHGLKVADRFSVVSPSTTTEVEGEYFVVSAGTTSVTANLTKNATSTSHYKVTVNDALIAGAAGNLEYSYDVGQHYPFFANAWETILPSGVRPSNTNFVASVGSPALVGYGNHYEKAGYWPGSSGDGDGATGLLVDEGGFPFDFKTTNVGPTGVDVQKSPAENMRHPNRVMAYVMIYCDKDAADSTYFLGRVFRKEFGAA